MEKTFTLFDCAICFLPFDSNNKAPSTLLCGHTFCVECTMGFGAHEKQYARSVELIENDALPFGVVTSRIVQEKLLLLKCPTCRYVTVLVPGQRPQKNYTLIDLINAREENLKSNPIVHALSEVTNF